MNKLMIAAFLLCCLVSTAGAAVLSVNFTEVGGADLLPDKEVNLRFDLVDLSQQFFLDAVKENFWEYSFGEIPNYVNPLIDSSSSFSLSVSEVNSDLKCNYFLMGADREQVVINRNADYDFGAGKYWLLVDADDWQECSIRLSVGEEWASFVLDFSRLPSAYDYAEQFKYPCRDNRLCIRDPQGNEFDLSGCLELGAPVEVCVNGELAFLDWKAGKAEAERQQAQEKVAELESRTEPEMVEAVKDLNESLIYLSGHLTAQREESDELFSSILLGAIILVVVVAFVFHKRGVPLPLRSLKFDSISEKASEYFAQFKSIKPEKKVPEGADGLSSFEQYSDEFQEGYD